MDLSFLKQALPTLATALGGPFAGLAAGFIADKLGVSDKTVANINEVLTKATMDPTALVEMKKIDVEFEKYLKQVDVDIFKIEAQDRDSARNREVAVKDLTPRILAYAITVGFFFILFYVAREGLPAGSEQVTIYMLGSLSTAWTTIMAYYYGSTKGSSDKTAVMASVVASNGNNSTGTNTAGGNKMDNEYLPEELTDRSQLWTGTVIELPEPCNPGSDQAIEYLGKLPYPFAPPDYILTYPRIGQAVMSPLGPARIVLLDGPKATIEYINDLGYAIGTAVVLISTLTY